MQWVKDGKVDADKRGYTYVEMFAEVVAVLEGSCTSKLDALSEHLGSTSEHLQALHPGGSTLDCTDGDFVHRPSPLQNRCIVLVSKMLMLRVEISDTISTTLWPTTDARRRHS